jgi:hypothetical protein
VVTPAGGVQGETARGGSAANGGSSAAGGGANTGGNSGEPPLSADCTDSATATGTFSVRYDAAQIPVVCARVE